MGGDGFVTTSSRFLLPFAPEDTRNWTEEIHLVYQLAQVAVGLRKELTEEDIKIREIEELGEAGDPNWLEEMKKLFNDQDETFDVLVGDEELVRKLGEQLEQEEAAYYESTIQS